MQTAMTPPPNSVLSATPRTPKTLTKRPRRARPDHKLGHVSERLASPTHCLTTLDPIPDDDECIDQILDLLDQDMGFRHWLDGEGASRDHRQRHGSLDSAYEEPSEEEQAEYVVKEAASAAVPQWRKRLIEQHTWSDPDLDEVKTLRRRGLFL